ncbi:protein ABHD11 [Drosophila hydei]|uniref:sn-1-specific diacylglycerol lipase ABHD11 n=1 Tax=Drosophila hydei TaxID=7224 RepID=A0A6J1M4H6_DROHY|nr:protein ABHD11 [Drosophila hydei]
MQLLNESLRCLSTCGATKSFFKCSANVSPAAVRYQYRRHYANVPAIAMSHEQFDGSAPDASRSPLITMHGLFGSKQNWRSISRALAKQTNRRVYTVDLRNHGDSPHTSTHNSLGMTADLVAFMQAKSISKTCVLGHSMGGRSGMHFTLSNPNLVERLIVVDISPVYMPRTIEDMTAIFKAMQDIDIPPNMSLSQGRQAAKKKLGETVDQSSVDFILLNLRKKPSTGEFYWACNVDVLVNSLHGFTHYSDHIADLPPYTGPTTFLCGTHSPYMQPESWPEVQKIFPNASIHWLDTGHLVHLEKPQEFIRIVTDFLNNP